MQTIDDDGTNQKNIFIDQIIKLALDDKVFNDLDAISELKTILLAVRKIKIIIILKWTEMNSSISLL